MVFQYWFYVSFILYTLCYGILCKINPQFGPVATNISYQLETIEKSELNKKIQRWIVISTLLLLIQHQKTNLANHTRM